jgi:hypothetical protein
MNKKEKIIIYLVFLQIFILLFVYNFFVGSQWMVDNLIGIGLLTFMFFINKWLKVGKIGFALFSIALLIHNLGTFDFYSWSWGILAYDNVVHLTNAMVGAYIFFNFIARKLHVKKNQRVKFTVVDEHKVIFVFLVIASVAMLGTVVEIIEFLGFMYLGPGEGMLFFGPGDSGKSDDAAGIYTDAMSDIMVNLLGSIIGALLYYYVKYRNQPWIRYQNN